MSERTVDEIREAILENLYKIWMDNTQGAWIFGDKAPNEDWEPDATLAIRECKQMEFYGWVEILSETPQIPYATVRLTPFGRETWETYLTAKEKEPLISLSQTLA